MKSIFNIITEIEQSGRDAVLCTIVNTKGSTPRKTGAKMIVYADGKIDGTIGGGELEKKVMEDALKVLKHGQPELFKHDLLHQLGMCCGGTVEIFLEPIMKNNTLYIFGAGHTGLALAVFAEKTNFQIVLIDERKDLMDQCTSPAVNKMNLPYADALKMLPFDEKTYICIMTYSHPLDRDILAYCIKKSFAYLGMIGSKRKVEVTKKMFTEGLGISASELDKVDMPMGLDIGAEGPAEIALSILAKLVEVKNKLIADTIQITKRK